jgi:hypothetical protein
MSKLIIFDECVFLASEIVYVGIADSVGGYSKPTWDIEIHVRGFDVDTYIWEYATKEERYARFTRLVEDWNNALR